LNEEFGRLLDSLLKLSVKSSFAAGPLRMPPESEGTAVVSGAASCEWRSAEAAFTPITICPWQFGELFICEETDALYGQHIVELKTRQIVDIAVGTADGDADEGAGDSSAFSHVDAGQLGETLSDYTRQMAVSLMVLHVRNVPVVAARFA
jgi:hypothetical protein